MRLKIAVLPGDGIGPEVTAESIRVLQVIAGIHGYRFDFEELLIGGEAIRKTGTPLPPTTLDACLSSDAVLLGAVGSPEFDALPPHQRPEAGLLLLRRGWAVSQTFDLRSRMSQLRTVLHCVLRYRKAQIF